MSTADEFFDMADVEHEIEELRSSASAIADSDAVVAQGEIEYTIYTFRDRSTLTLGTDGFIGSVPPPNSEAHLGDSTSFDM